MLLTQDVLAGSPLARQLELEDESIASGVARYRRLAQDAVNRGEGAMLKPAARLLAYWHDGLARIIKAEQDACRNGEPGEGRRTYGPIICSIPPEIAAAATIRAILAALMLHPQGMYRGAIAVVVGKALVAEFNLRRMKKSKFKYRRPKRGQRPERAVDHVMKASRKLEGHVSGMRMYAALGWVATWHAIEFCCLPLADGSTAPAFTYERGIKGRRIKPMVHMTQACRDAIEMGHMERQYLRPSYLPMLVAPLKRVGSPERGYLKIKTPVVGNPCRLLKSALKDINHDESLECLESVETTAWSVNLDLLRVMRRHWHEGGPLLPARNNLPLPPKMDNPTDEEKRKRRTENADIHERNVKLQSERFQFLQKLAIAQRFAGEEAFWFPHVMDFRGRCYPIPQHLNHHGDDVCRGLLEFAEPAQPSQDTQEWLAVHAANCYGIDKVAFSDRIDWVNKHWSDIERSAKDPDGCEFWHHADKGEKPWQFLAACMALTDKKAGAKMPVQFDGSSNGLQHYAAMGRDEDSARVVNLVPSEQMEDIYGLICMKVRELVILDSNPLAKLVLPHISRSTVKQPVMTTVYGVTRIGMQQQILSKLPANWEHRNDAKRYLAMMVSLAIGEVMKGASEIMDWLRSAAREWCRRMPNKPLGWISPLGFPVIQPYWCKRRLDVNTAVGPITVYTKMDEDMPVDVRRQINGIAPNFVHSVDAAHLMMTARECAKRRIAMAAVHDSYWFHAANAKMGNLILRGEFIRLHEADPLVNLADYLRRSCPDIPALPARGHLDLSQITEAKYAFS